MSGFLSKGSVFVMHLRKDGGFFEKLSLHLIVTYLNWIVHKLRDENVTCKRRLQPFQSMLSESPNTLHSLTEPNCNLWYSHDIYDTFIMAYPVFHVYSTLMEYRVYQKHIEPPYSSLISDWISWHCRCISPVYRGVAIVNAPHTISTNLRTNLLLFFFRYILEWLFMKYHTENHFTAVSASLNQMLCSY